MRHIELTEEKSSQIETKLSKQILPNQHFNEITRLGTKLQIAKPNQDFKTAFNKIKTIFTFCFILFIKI